MDMMEQVGFEEIFFFLDSSRLFCRSKTKNQRKIYELSEFLIWEAKQIKLRNATILVDCSKQ